MCFVQGCTALFKAVQGCTIQVPTWKATAFFLVDCLFGISESMCYWGIVESAMWSNICLALTCQNCSELTGRFSAPFELCTVPMNSTPTCTDTHTVRWISIGHCRLPVMKQCCLYQDCFMHRLSFTVIGAIKWRNGLQGPRSSQRCQAGS